MKLLICITLTVLLVLGCSFIPTGKSDVEPVNLDGTWQSRYLRVAQVVVDGETGTIEQTSTLTIEGNQYRFVFDPPTPLSILHFELLDEISGSFTLTHSTIYFYDTTGNVLLEKLNYDIDDKTLTMSYPFGPDTTENNDIIVPIRLGALPWGYAMNVWEPFVNYDKLNEDENVVIK